MASRNDRFPRFSVYHNGRGSEPMIVVGRRMLAVALYMRTPFFLGMRDEGGGMSQGRAKVTLVTGRAFPASAGDELPDLVDLAGRALQPLLRPLAGLRDEVSIDY